MIKRVITAFIIIACVVPPLLLGGYFLDALIMLVVMVGGFELVNVLADRKFIATNWLFFCFLISAGAILVPMNYGAAMMALLVLFIIATPVFYKKLSSENAFYIVGCVLLLFIFGTSFKMVYAYSHLYIWFILLATYGCDTGAYVIGSMFGKTKLIPTISPNKTVEGAFGGWFLGAALAFLFAVFVIGNMNLLLLILSCLWLPVVSQIGDLTFSAIKRNFNIKDFSNIFPGHGGFMDRIDSLVFNLIVFAAFMVFVL